MSKCYLKSQFEKREEYENRLKNGETLSASEMKEYKLIKLSTKGFERRQNNLVILFYMIIGTVAGDILSGINPKAMALCTSLLVCLVIEIYLYSKTHVLSVKFFRNYKFKFMPFLFLFSQDAFFPLTIEDRMISTYIIYCSCMLLFLVVMAYKTTKASNKSFERLVKEYE